MIRFNTLHLPHFIVFEGVDGSGKTTLARALKQYYIAVAPDLLLYADAFPGSIPGTLGEWVYRFHHKKVADAPSPDTIAPPALQLLHIAAHVDALLTRILPTIEKNGSVILDRYWWSTYSYLRISLPARQVWPIVSIEHTFLEQLPSPTIIYLTRKTSLKPDELSTAVHTQLDTYYHEVMEYEQQRNPRIFQLSNDNSIEQTWTTLLATLGLPYGPLNL